jgi:excisionase family DNA binding protein
MTGKPRNHNGFAPLTVRVVVASQMLGIGKTKIYELIADHEIEVLKLGRATLIPIASLEAFIDRQRASLTPEPPPKTRRGRPRKTFVTLLAARRP